MNNQNTLEEFSEKIKEDKNVLGLILSGSQALGIANEHSDYDLTLIVVDEKNDEYQEKYEDVSYFPLELVVRSFSEFKTYADWGTEEEWDRADFLGAKVLFDKNEEITKLVKEKATIFPEKSKERIEKNLDAYIDSTLRSVKAIRGDGDLAAQLFANQAIYYLLPLLFALHDRLNPFLSRLEAELQSNPLENLPWNSDVFLEKIKSISNNADLKAQQAILEVIENIAIKNGYGQMIEDWEGKDKEAIDYRPE